MPLGRRRRRDEQKKPQPQPLGPVRIHCTVIGEADEAPRLVVDTGFETVGVFENTSRLTFTIPGDVPKWGFWIYWSKNRSIRATNQDGTDMALPPAGDYEGPALDYSPAELPNVALGPVTLSQRTWMNATGPFHPLASTLFWAVGGVKTGSGSRVLQNYNFIKANGGVAVRILAQVNWEGEIGNVDERWPDYENALGQTIELAAQAGLLVKVTCIGGGVHDLGLLTDKLCRVLPAWRDSIIMVEGCNEGNAKAEDVTYLLNKLMPLLPGVPFAPGFGDQGDMAVELADEIGASVDVLHTERTLGDQKDPGGQHARQARQGWNFANGNRRKRAQDWGEPPGPASSVATLDDPAILAASFACAIICGAGFGCLHTGSGVFGKTYDSKHGRRYANLWEVPGIVEMFKAMTTAAALLPADVCNWKAFNNPLVVERVNLQPSEGLGRGQCDKIYGARAGNQFVEIVLGCDPVIRLKGVPGCLYKIVDTATGAVFADGIRGGDEVTVNAGAWSYLVIGTT